MGRLGPHVGAHLRECCDRQNLTRMLPPPRVNDMCLSCGAHWHGTIDAVASYTRREWDEIQNAALDAERTFPKEGEEVDIEFADGHYERATYRCGALFTSAEVWGLHEHPFRLVRSNSELTRDDARRAEDSRGVPGCAGDNNGERK